MKNLNKLTMERLPTSASLMLIFSPLCFATFAIYNIAKQLLTDALATLVVQSFNSQLPCLNDKRIHIAHSKGGWDVDIQRLTLVNKLLTNRSLNDQFTLRNLLKGLENIFFFLSKEIKMLHRTLVEHNISPNLIVVFALLLKELFEITILANEVTLGETSLVVVGRVWFNTRRYLPED